MSKLKTTKIRLFIPAGAAAPTPPFGPIIAQYGVNTVQFCKEFNEATDNLTSFFDENFLLFDEFGGFILMVDICINEDKTYKYWVNKPPISFLLRLLADVKVGAPRKKIGFLTKREILFLAQFKFPELNLSSACFMIKGAARSIGIVILD